MIKFKNWFIESRVKNKFQAPELAIKVLVGEVYGHASFLDGSFIHTSPIVGVEDMGDHKDILTRTGSRYSVYPDDVSEGAEKAFPGYYNRLSMMEVM
jgi:hypothetical protein